VTKFWSVPYRTVKVRIRKHFFFNFHIKNRLDKLASKILHVNKKENSHEYKRFIYKKFIDKKNIQIVQNTVKKWKNQSLVSKKISKMHSRK